MGKGCNLSSIFLAREFDVSIHLQYSFINTPQKSKGLCADDIDNDSVLNISTRCPIVFHLYI